MARYHPHTIPIDGRSTLVWKDRQMSACDVRFYLFGAGQDLDRNGLADALEPFLQEPALPETAAVPQAAAPHVTASHDTFTGKAAADATLQRATPCQAAIPCLRDVRGADLDRNHFPENIFPDITRVHIECGHPAGVRGNRCICCTPAWFRGTLTQGGSWHAFIPPAQPLAALPDGAAADPVLVLPSQERLLILDNQSGARFILELNPGCFAADLVMEIAGCGNAAASLHVALLDDRRHTLNPDCTGNLLSESRGSWITRQAVIPLSAFPETARIVLCGQGALDLGRIMLYPDQDCDGLDTACEARLGTADTRADSDNDGFDDLREVRACADPLSAASTPLAPAPRSKARAGTTALKSAIITRLAITNIVRIPDGFVLQIAGPDHIASIDIFAAASMDASDWVLCDRDVGFSRTLHWSGAFDNANRFLAVGDASTDSDNDGVPDCREWMVLHSRTDLADTDGDGHLDGYDPTPLMHDADLDRMLDDCEQAIVDADPNDALHTLHDVFPDEDYDEDGISNGDECRLGSSPVNGSNKPPRMFFETIETLIAEPNYTNSPASTAMVAVALSPASAHTVTGSVTLIGGNATPNQDFTNNLPLHLTFQSGETRKWVYIKILPDRVYESEETICLQIVGAFTGGDDKHAVKITNTQESLGSDGDRLPDWWEKAFFGHTNYGDADDPDLDQLSNYVEYRLGGNPMKTAIRDTTGRINLKITTPSF